eukprot:1578799-Rhodomonas_salina.1
MSRIVLVQSQTVLCNVTHCAAKEPPPKALPLVSSTAGVTATHSSPPPRNQKLSPLFPGTNCTAHACLMPLTPRSLPPVHRECSSCAPRTRTLRVTCPRSP